MTWYHHECCDSKGWSVMNNTMRIATQNRFFVAIGCRQQQTTDVLPIGVRGKVANSDGGHRSSSSLVPVYVVPGNCIAHSLISAAFVPRNSGPPQHRTPPAKSLAINTLASSAHDSCTAGEGRWCLNTHNKTPLSKSHAYMYFPP